VLGHLERQMRRAPAGARIGVVECDVERLHVRQ